METCPSHSGLSKRVDALEGKHEGLYNRVRDNETKYMPAVKAAFEAKEEVAKVKEDMQEKLSHLSASDSVQDIKLDALHRREDIADKQRTKQAEAIDSIHDEVVILGTTFKTSVKIITGLSAIFTVSLITFGAWIVISITKNQADNQVMQGMLRSLVEQNKSNKKD